MSVGIAYPPYGYDVKSYAQLTSEAAEWAVKRLDPTKPDQKKRIDDVRENAEWVIALAEASGIEKRHSHLKDGIQFYRDRNFFPTTQERAEIWRKECPALAMKAVDKCLTNWGGDKDRIRTVVAHSTTGWDVPGLAHHIIFNLELPQDARAVPVMFVGCQGGMTILYVGKVIAESVSNENHLVLSVGAEIQTTLGRFYDEKCSLERSLYMPMVLFGEGAAACVIGRPDLSRDTKFPLWEWGNMGAYYIPNTRHVLMIGISEEDNMYIENSIKKELPVHLNAELTKHLGKWLKHALGVNINDADFAVHPGGLKLLKNFSKLLEDMGCTDGDAATKYSTRNLVTYGNLASAAVLFILHDLVQYSPKDHIYCMAMGPGVCMEYGGLHRFDPSKSSKRKTQTGKGGSFTWLLLAIIVGLIAFIVSGYTINDVKQAL
jgi:predicted naringenin-chalcone synthase